MSAPSKPTSAANKGKIEKRVKPKLTKEQKLYVKELVSLQNRIAVCREYIDLWMQFFRPFAEMNEDREITPAEEKAFFHTMTNLSRRHFLFAEMMGDAYDGANDIMKILAQAVSLSTIKLMQENTRDKLMLDWHAQFLMMNKALGRLLRMLPDNRPITVLMAEFRAKPIPARAEKPEKAAAAK